MSAITITIRIDVPEGARVEVGGADFAEYPPLENRLPPPARTFGDGPGDCPVHRVPFTWKEAGVTKAGKHYDGFWKCGEKNADDSYCKQKPA